MCSRNEQIKQRKSRVLGVAIASYKKIARHFLDLHRVSIGNFNDGSGKRFEIFRNSSGSHFERVASVQQSRPADFSRHE